MSEDSTTTTDGDTQALGGDTPLVDPGPEWMGGLSEELQTNNGLTKFKDVDGLAKSYLELEKSNSSKFGVPEKDDSEGWDKLYGKLGRPEKAEDYSLEGIENEELAGVEENKATIDRFKEIGHQYGLNNRQVSGIINDVLGMTAEQAKASSEANAQNIQELREAFGPEFDNRVALANDTLKKMVDKTGGDWDRVSQALAQSGLHSQPDLLKALAGVGRMFQQDKIWGAGGEPRSMGGHTPGEAREQIEAITAEFMDDIIKETPVGLQKQKEIDKLMDIIARSG